MVEACLAGTYILHITLSFGLKQELRRQSIPVLHRDSPDSAPKNGIAGIASRPLTMIVMNLQVPLDSPRNIPRSCSHHIHVTMLP